MTLKEGSKKVERIHNNGERLIKLAIKTREIYYKTENIFVKILSIMVNKFCIDLVKRRYKRAFKIVDEVFKGI